MYMLMLPSVRNSDDGLRIRKALIDERCKTMSSNFIQLSNEGYSDSLQRVMLSSCITSPSIDSDISNRDRSIVMAGYSGGHAKLWLDGGSGECRTLELPHDDNEGAGAAGAAQAAGGGGVPVPLALGVAAQDRYGELSFISVAANHSIAVAVAGGGKLHIWGTGATSPHLETFVVDPGTKVPSDFLRNNNIGGTLLDNPKSFYFCFVSFFLERVTGLVIINQAPRGPCCTCLPWSDLFAWRSCMYLPRYIQ